MSQEIVSAFPSKYNKHKLYTYVCTYVHHQRQDKQTGDQVTVTVDYTILGKIFRFVIISFEVSSFKTP